MSEQTQASQREAEAKERLNAIRRQQQEERDAHRATMAAEAEKSKTALEVTLEKLTKPEQRQVRLHAYLHVLKSDWDQASHLQTHVDNVTLRLARYMADGTV